MEQKQKNTQAGEESLHKTTNKVITNAMSETPKMSELKDQKVAAVELISFGLGMKLIRRFSMWRTQKCLD